MMKKTVSPRSLMLVAALLAFWAAACQASDAFDVSSKPRIAVIPNQKMLVITMTGDPEKTSGPAFRSLYKYFYQHADRQSKKESPAPRVRWTLAPDLQDKALWVGEYGLPVPEGFPAPTAGNLRIEDWKYGLVAEILHIGPYTTEAPTLDRLRDFIQLNGYAAIGEHEEEYLVGPGMFFKGHPERYRTLIRYRLAGNLLRPDGDDKVTAAR